MREIGTKMNDTPTPEGPSRGGSGDEGEKWAADAVRELLELLDMSPEGIVDVPGHNALWRAPNSEFSIDRSALADVADDELHARTFVSVYDHTGRKHLASQHAPGWLDAAVAETSRFAVSAVQHLPNVAIAAAGYIVAHRLEVARPAWATGHVYVAIVDGRGMVEFSGDVGRVTVEASMSVEGDTWTPGAPTVQLPADVPAEDVFALAADLIDVAIATLAGSVDEGAVAGWHVLSEAVRSEGVRE